MSMSVQYDNRYFESAESFAHPCCNGLIVYHEALQTQLFIRFLAPNLILYSFICNVIHSFDVSLMKISATFCSYNECQLLFS